ncbi:Clavaminate synthase-like protein [Linderina pennispora]|uniref:Clavaminate synthase-like protein n=1 Tax=Linderina pennispora TaxID=61395 RepID=A0A1Y1W206_9FUNG|nr:Clavaminate synthase-like protein [Linderina pennispora]ORX67482.1 Clavaminate synthase-like protein [Linderina pennispora]
MTATTQFELKPDWARVYLNQATHTQTSTTSGCGTTAHVLSGCRHEKTKERTIDAAIIPLDIQPLRAEPTTTEEGPAIAFYWAPIAVKDDAGQLVVPDETEHSWPPKYGDAGQLTLKGKQVYKAQLYDLLKKFGVVVVRGRGSDTEDIIYDFVDSDDAVIPTHFGRIEHLRTDNVENANNDQLGYTNAAVRLHTDQCYAETVPGFQFLHCIRPADVGGDNYFVHAESAANYLKTEVSSRAYDLLTSVPVRFDRKQSKFQALHCRLEQVRYSYFTQAAQNNVPFAQLREWYELLYRDDFQLKATLESGDFHLWAHLEQAKQQSAGCLNRPHPPIHNFSG